MTLESPPPVVYKIHIKYTLWKPMDRVQFPMITDATIAALIDAFYTAIRRHPALGPIFDAAIPADAWSGHLATMRDFWSSVMLGSGRYSGNPVAAHRAVAGLEPPLFAVWLDLFTATASDLFAPARAAELAAKARRIAGSLETAVFHRLPNGVAGRPAA